MRIKYVGAERFVVGVGDREVVSCGRGDCRCYFGIVVRAGIVWRAWNREIVW